MTKSHEGGCHCKAVRYEVELDLDQPVIECNCSHCGAKGLLLQFVPMEKFTILSGKDAVTEYRFNKQTIAHQFCSTCGVQPFAFATDKEGVPTAAVNVRTVDGVDIAALTRTQVNGKDF